MIKQIKENIWQFNFTEFGSCVYLLIIDNKKIIIDTGARANRQELIQYLKELKLTPEDIDIVILTHNHYDHIENADLFSKAKVYGNKNDFKQENILNIDTLNMPELKIIETPGHTPGGICILYKDVLFSGDTLFNHGHIGRTDFPGGDYEKIIDSLETLSKVKYNTLCPGHLT